MKPQEEELIRGLAIKAFEKVTWSMAKTRMFGLDKEAEALFYFKNKKEEKLGKAADKPQICGREMGWGEYESLTNNISRLPLKFEDNGGTSEDLGLKSVVLKHMTLSKQK